MTGADYTLGGPPNWSASADYRPSHAPTMPDFISGMDRFSNFGNPVASIGQAAQGIANDIKDQQMSGGDDTMSKLRGLVAATKNSPASAADMKFIEPGKMPEAPISLGAMQARPPGYQSFADGGIARGALPTMAGVMAAMDAIRQQGQPGAAGGGAPPTQAPLMAADGMFISQGAGNGTSDSVDAKVSQGEFVMPADVVSALGSGSSNAGAQWLINLCKQIRMKHSNKMTNAPEPVR